MKDKKDIFEKNFIISIITIFFVILIFIIGLAYLIFSCNNLFLYCKGLNKGDWLSFVGSAIATSGTIVLGIIAIYQNKKANQINENILCNEIKELELSMKPIVQCFLNVYFGKENSRPYIVLVTENFGKSTAYEVKINAFVPDELKISKFYNEVKKLENQTFTLAPGQKLSTPVCWKEEYINNNLEITADGEYKYYTPDNKLQTETVPKISLSVGEKELFDAISFLKEN